MLTFHNEFVFIYGLSSLSRIIIFSYRFVSNFSVWYAVSLDLFLIISLFIHKHWSFIQFVFAFFIVFMIFQFRFLYYLYFFYLNLLLDATLVLLKEFFIIKFQYIICDPCLFPNLLYSIAVVVVIIVSISLHCCGISTLYGDMM